MIWHSIKDLLFPRGCAGCGQQLALDEQFVCPQCMLNLPWETRHEWVYNRRMTIRTQHPCLQRMGALMRYRRDNIAAEIVRNMKFHRRPELGTWMGHLAAEQLQDTGLFDDVNVLIPIPLTASRLHYRGFNQSEMIAGAMAAVLGIEMSTDALCRIRDIESQTHFRLHERLENAKDIFALTDHAQVLAGKHVMIVDDVMTTGRTMLSAIEKLEAVPDIRLSTFAWAWTPAQPKVSDT